MYWKLHNIIYFQAIARVDLRKILVALCMLGLWELRRELALKVESEIFPKELKKKLQKVISRYDKENSF